MISEARDHRIGGAMKQCCMVCHHLGVLYEVQ